MTDISHTGFLGTSEHSFALTDPMIAELERTTGTGIGAIYKRLVTTEFHGADIAEIIRLGLIGGGLNPQDAHSLVGTYVRNRPMAEVLPLALDILDCRWSGKEPTPEEPKENE